VQARVPRGLGISQPFHEIYFIFVLLNTPYLDFYFLIFNYFILFLLIRFCGTIFSFCKARASIPYGEMPLHRLEFLL
jgi:hypothetical protein